MRTVAEQLVDYLQDRGVNHIFGLCGHTNIAVLAALEHSPIEFVNVRHEQVASHAADAYARVTRQSQRPAQPSQPGTHQRSDRSGERRGGLHPHGGDIRRRPFVLFRQAPSPRSQPALRWGSIRDLPTVREAGLESRNTGVVPRDDRKGFCSRRIGPARPGPRRCPDEHLLGENRP